MERKGAFQQKFPLDFEVIKNHIGETYLGIFLLRKLHFRVARKVTGVNLTDHIIDVVITLFDDNQVNFEKVKWFFSICPLLKLI